MRRNETLRRLRSSRGSLLVQVAVAGLIVAYAASLILKLTLQPAMNTANAVNGVKGSGTAEAALNKVSAAWISTGGTCTSLASVGVTCSAGSGCSCTCRVAGLPSVRASGPAAGPCSLTVLAP